MKKKSKIICMILCVCLILLAFTACNTRKNANSQSNDTKLSESESEQITCTSPTHSSQPSNTQKEELTSSENPESPYKSIVACSIQFFGGNYSYTRDSNYYTNYTIEEVSIEEFESNSDNFSQKVFISGNIYENKKVNALIYYRDPNNYFNSYNSYTATIDQIEEVIGNTYYIYHPSTNKPAKITYHELILSYLNITHLPDGTIELSRFINMNKDIQTEKIKSENYVITYFLNN